MNFNVGEVVTFMSTGGMSIVGVVKEDFNTEKDNYFYLELACAIVQDMDGKHSLSPISVQTVDKCQSFIKTSLLTLPRSVDESLKESYLVAIGIKKIATPPVMSIVT